MKKIFVLISLVILAYQLNSVYHKVNDLSVEGTSYPNIEIVDNIAYVADHTYGLRIYDISDPVEPVLINSLALEYDIHTIILEHPFAYLLSYYDCTMYILDIHDITNPILLNQYNTMYPCRNVSVNANYAFISTRHELNTPPWDEYFIEIVDIEDTAAPFYVDLIEIASYCPTINIINDIAYVGTYLGLYVYNIDDIHNFVQIDWLDTGNTHSLKIHNDLLFFAGSEGLYVVDYADPYNNRVLSTNPDIFFYQCDIVDNILYSNHGYMMSSVDISDPYNPSLISTFNSIQPSYQVAVYEDFVYRSNCSESIDIIDVTTPQAAILLNQEDIKSSMLEKSPDNEYMMIYGHSMDGLHFYKMEDPLNPEYMYSHISHSGSWHCRDFYIDEDICCSVFGTKFYVYDLSNEESLTFSGIIDLWDYANYIARRGNYIYLGCLGENIKIIDISDTFNPQIVATIDVQGWMIDLSITSDLLCFVNIDGLRIFNIADPLYPVEVGFWDSTNSAVALTLFDGFAYISDFDGGLRVIDLSDPQNPQLINTLELNDNSRLYDAPIIRDNKLFVMDKYWNEIFLYDLENPSLPEFLFSYRWNHYSIDLEVFDNYIYSANGYDDRENYGLSLLDFSEYLTQAENDILSPHDLNHLSNYPNPFNPSGAGRGPTTTISFELNTEITRLRQGYAGQAENTEVEIYNIKGQKVKSFPSGSFHPSVAVHSPEPVEGRGESSSYSVTWNGTDQNNKPVASGVYFYKLKVDGKTKAVKKCLLLK